MTTTHTHTHTKHKTKQNQKRSNPQALFFLDEAYVNMDKALICLNTSNLSSCVRKIMHATQYYVISINDEQCIVSSFEVYQQRKVWCQ